MFPERPRPDKGSPIQSLLPLPPEREQPATAAVPAQGHPQDLPHPLQGAGRARAAGRLLPKPGRLVGAERAQRRPG